MSELQTLDVQMQEPELLETYMYVPPQAVFQPLTEDIIRIIAQPYTVAGWKVVVDSLANSANLVYVNGHYFIKALMFRQLPVRTR